MSEKPIILKDNHLSRELYADEAEKLLRFAGCSLGKLCADNPSLLLFPDNLGDNGDAIEEPLFSIAENKLWTGNMVGFWGVDGVNVRVHSRFDDAKSQYFFHYMLQRISGINVIDFKTLPDSENIWDFLIYLFPMALKRAVRQGILRAYRVFRYDDDRVRGAIDVPRFIRQDIPFAGKVAYSTREHTANNHVLQLVRHTIEFIRRAAPVLLSADSEMRQAVDTVVRVTPDYADRFRNKVIAANLRPVRHPFFSVYTGLQKLCLQILRHENLSFGESDGSICGIIFDAAWVWEEYLAAVFETDAKTKTIVHPRNKLRQNPVPFFRNGRTSPHYPDFYDKTLGIVLDAKYKHLDEQRIGREDLFQLVSYMHVLKGSTGVLLYPSKVGKSRFDLDGDLEGWGGRVGRLSFSIPQSGCSTFEDFSRKMAKAENNFVTTVEEAWRGGRRELLV